MGEPYLDPWEDDPATPREEEEKRAKEAFTSELSTLFSEKNANMNMGDKIAGLVNGIDRFTSTLIVINNKFAG